MSVLRNSIQLITKHIAYWALFIAVIFTVLVATVYWVSNAIEQRKDEIAQWIGDELNYPVEVGDAGLHWVGAKPKLHLQSVTVFQNDGRTKLLSLSELYFGLDIVKSIHNGDPVLNDITLIGLNLRLVRDEFSEFQVQGFNKLKPKAVTTGNMDWLNAVRSLNSFNFQSITVDYIDQITPSLSGVYKLRNSTLNYKGKRWATKATLKLPVGFGDDIQVQAEGQLNDNLLKADWQWQIDASQLQLERLASLLIWQDVALMQAQVDTRISGHNIGMAIDTMSANISLSNAKIVSLQTNTVTSPVFINSLRGNIDWQRDSQSWQIASKQLQVTVNDEPWPLTDFSIDKKKATWLINASFLPVSDLTAFALLSAHAPEQIKQQKPAGDIEHLHLRYSAETGLESLSFNLVEGELLPWQTLPGVSGLTANVSWLNNEAKLSLNSHNITLYPEAWLKDGVFFDSITGQLNYQQGEGERWQIQSNAFRVWNDDLTLQLDGSIEKNSEGKIINDLNLSLEDVAVNQWQKYIPQQGFDPSFKEWVTQAFPAGKIVAGTIIWQGDIAEFPYIKEEQKGKFDLSLQAKGVQLHYAPDWPDLKNVDATITGDGNNLFIKSKHGTEAGFDFNYVTTTISKLAEEGASQLVAEADLKGTTDKALQFLLNSPLKEKFGNAVETVKAAGESRIRFKLDVPLSDVDETQVVGDISFIDSALYEASATEIGVTKINGLLLFSNTGVTAEGITAQFLNNPIVLNVKPTKKDTAISVTGKVDMADINTIWPNKVPEFISGKTDYTVNVTVVEESYGEFYVDAGLSSDLEGLQIALPTPIKKDKTSKKPFTASFKHIDDSLAYVIKYGEQFNAIVMNNTDLWRGELRFGSGEAKLPKLGVRVRGQLNELVLDDWLALVDEQQAGEESALVKSLDDVSIEISALKGFEQLFEHVNLSAERDAQGWRAKIHSDQAKGSIYIPNDFENNAILKIKLDEARLLTSKTEAKKAEGSQLAKTKKSTLWPSMDISIKSLFLDGFALGKLDIQASQHARAWRVDSASLQSDIFTATTNVPNISQKSEWKQTETGDISTLQLQAKSNNISQLLANFDYQEVIEAEEATFTISLSWADNPLALFSHPLQGRLTVDVGEGALIEVEPGAAGRIFGLLSVAAIPQRLSLDFSDLFGEGFSFDSIKGTFDLANGLATTNDFELKGAPATVEMRGPIDLANKRYNQKVTIRPNVSSALPLAGAVAAGPVGLAAGAAILLFDKVAGTIFDTEIVNIISYSYNLTGPWDEPEMTVARPKTP